VGEHSLIGVDIILQPVKPYGLEALSEANWDEAPIFNILS